MCSFLKALLTPCRFSPWRREQSRSEKKGNANVHLSGISCAACSPSPQKFQGFHVGDFRKWKYGDLVGILDRPTYLHLVLLINWIIPKWGGGPAKFFPLQNYCHYKVRGPRFESWCLGSDTTLGYPQQSHESKRPYLTEREADLWPFLLSTNQMHLFQSCDLHAQMMANSLGDHLKLEFCKSDHIWLIYGHFCSRPIRGLDFSHVTCMLRWWPMASMTI